MSLKKINNFINKYATTILVVAILFYVLIFFGLSYYKYLNFLYNSLDLAIFNQVFFNTSHGRFFALSIHEPTYLGDHFKPIIIPLAFLYSLYRSPLTLLFFQTVILSLSAWPIYLITKTIIGGKIWPLIISLTWLINPLVHNANLFEFHLLPLATFFLFWVYYFYLQKKWPLFFLFSILSLLVREDVSLVILMVGVLAVIESLNIEKNRLLKIINPKQFTTGLVIILMSLCWFVLGMKIISHYATDGSYKFLLYYSWLGSSFFEILISPLTKPLIILGHLLTVSNIEMFFGLLLPFVFLPLFFKKNLILLVGPLLQFLLGAPGGSSLIFQTHYSLLMLPALVISTIYAIDYFIHQPVGQKNSLEIVRILSQSKEFLLILFIISTIFGSLAIGPLLGSIKKIYYSTKPSVEVEIKNKFIEKIPQNAKVVTTSNYLSNLSSRRYVYSMHYVYIGKKQFSEKDYLIPEDTDYLLIDFDEFLEYPTQFKDHYVYGKFFKNTSKNMQILLDKFTLIDIFDTQVLFKKKEYGDKEMLLYQISDTAPKFETTLSYEDNIAFKGWQMNENNVAGEMSRDARILPMSLFWQTKKDLSGLDNYQIKMMIYEGDKIVYEKLYPLAYNLFPVAQWTPKQTVQSNYWFYIPENISSDAVLQFAVIEPKDHLELNSLRTAQFFSEGRPLSPSIVIDKIGRFRNRQ
jgi:uncharacterized membrane protein